MHILTTIVIVLSLVGLGIWWTAPSVKNRASDSTPTGKTAVEKNILDPIGKANRAKTLLESEHATSLDLSNQNLTSVPQDIFTNSNLESLNVSHNKLTGSLPGEIRHLQKLTSLNLSWNEFTGVPAEIGQLTDLQILDLSHNQLTGLPYELGNLKNLSQLLLTGNNYSEADLETIRKTLPADVVITTN